MNKSITSLIGKSQSKEGIIDHTLVRRIAAMFNQPALDIGDSLPLLWHWAFFQPELPALALGIDGHPIQGAFLPANPGYQRMWAGGSFRFNEPLVIGQSAQCLSTINDIQEKKGQNGSLLFITVCHEYIQQEKILFTEEQHIVYREPSPPKLISHAPPLANWSERIEPDALQLFRYSAVTFNGHRIHYDYPYATEVEGYENLVIHGPMMATWALQSFVHHHPEKTITEFNYRGLRPTTLPHPIDIAGRLVDEQHADVWVSNDNGIIQQGHIKFHL